MELAFKYFYIAGAGVGLGLSTTILPCLLLYKKMKDGGVKVWRRKRK